MLVIAFLIMLSDGWVNSLVPEKILLEEFGYSCKDLTLTTIVNKSDEVYFVQVLGEYTPIPINKGRMSYGELESQGYSLNEAAYIRWNEYIRQFSKVYEFRVVEQLKGNQQGKVLYKVNDPIYLSKGRLRGRNIENNKLYNCVMPIEFEVGSYYVVFPESLNHPENMIKVDLESKARLERVKKILSK